MKLLDISTPKHPNLFTKVDDEDFEYLNQWKWRFSGNGYAIRTEPKSGKKKILLHRFLVNTPKGMFTDHINGDRLDNQKVNIRYCTKTENNRNVKKKASPSLSKFKGVSKTGKLYSSGIFINGKYKLSYFNNELDAAKHYNEMALKYYGDFAKLNTF